MSLDPGQAEAGRSLGLNYIDTMRLIVIPQAFKAILPSLGNEFIVLLKDTSLITVIGGKELVNAAQGIYNRTYEQMFPLVGTALIYLLLVMLFSLTLGWLPSQGMGDGFIPLLKSLVLPSFTLGINSCAMVARMTRSSMLEVIRQDYIYTARAKGVDEKKITTRHMLRNALIPVVTSVGPLIAGILTGSDAKGTFNPTSSIKRSEVAAILNRMFDETMRQMMKRMKSAGKKGGRGMGLPGLGFGGKGGRFGF